MTTRNAVVATIALTVLLSFGVSLAAMFAGDINDRAYDIAKNVLLAYGGITAGLLVWMRLDTLSGKADEAAVHAAVAANKADAAAEVSREIKHDIHNDVLKNKVRQAIAEERHMLANRGAAKPMREQLEARGMPKRDAAD